MGCPSGRHRGIYLYWGEVVGIGVEHRDFRDPIHRQAVALRCAADRFGARRFVYAESLSRLISNVGVNPGDPPVRVAGDDRREDLPPLRAGWDHQTVGERTFY